MMSRRWLPWVLIGGLAALMLMVGAAASWWAIRAYGPAVSRERMEAALSAALERPVRIERVAIRPWLGRLELHGVRVSADPEHRATLATVGRAWASVGVASLWRRELVVSRIALEDVDVRLVAAGDGEPFELPPTIPDRIDLGPVTAVVALVEVRQARIAFTDPAAGRAVLVDGAHLSARPRKGGLALQATVGTLQVRTAAFDETIERLAFSGSLLGDHVTVDELDLRWRAERLRVAGDVRGLPDAPVLALTVTGTLPVRPIAEWAALEWPLEGVARVDASLRGAVADPAVAATLRIPRLVGGPIDASRVSGRLSWSDGQLRLTDVAAETLGGKVAGSLSLVPARPAQTRLQLRLSGVSIAALEPLIGTSLGARGVLTLDGGLEGDLRRVLEARGHAGLEASGVTVAGPLERAGAGAIKAEVRFADGVVEVVSGDARWPALAAELRQLRGRLDRDGPQDLRGLLTADLAAVARAWDRHDVKGRATVQAEASGSWRAPTVAGHAEFRDIAVAPVTLDSVTMPFRLDGRTLDVRGARLALGRSEGRVSGTLALPETEPIDVAALSRRLRVVLDVQESSLHLGDLRPWLPATPTMTGTVSVAGRVQGTPEAWRASGRASAATLGVAGERLDALQADFVADPRGVTVSRLTLRARGVPLTVDGDTTWSGTGAARFAAGPIELHQVSGVPPALSMRGLARARGELTWQQGVLSGSLQTVSERTSLIEVPLGRGTLNVTLDRGAMDAALAFPEARVTGTARGPVDGAPLEVRLVARDLALDRVLARTGFEAAGTVSVAAQLQVPARDPVAARGTIRLDPLELRVGGERWQSREALVLRREPGVTRIDRALLAARLGELSVAGVVNDTGGLALDVTGRSPLSVLAALRPEIREADGLLDVTARVTGTVSEPAVTGTGTLTAAIVVLRDVPEPVRDLRARFQLAPGVVRVTEARGVVAGGEVRARGQVPVPPAAGQLALEVTGRLPLGALAAFRPEIREADGTLDAALQLTGTLTAPTITGTGTLSASRVVLRDVPEPLRDVRARLSLAPGVVQIADGRATVAGGELRAQGQIPLPPGDGKLGLELTGRLPLGLLAAWRSEVRHADGALDVALTVSGTFTEPSLRGQGTLTAATLTLRDVPETLRDVRARFTVAPGSLRLVEATAQVGSGTLKGHGEAAIRGRALGGYRFTIEGRGVSVAAEGLQSTWDADLELVGFETRAQLRGETRLVRGSYTRDLSLLRMLLARDRPAPTPDAPGLHLDLVVTMEDRLLVRTPVARFRAGGRLTVQGTSSRPAVFGTVNARDGQLVFRKQVFTLTSASAHFADPRRLDPILDVRGEARIRGYDVTLHLSGQSDDLRIQLASRPPLPEEDVLALVAFGATRDQLGRAGGAAVAGEAAGFLIQELLGVRSDSAGIDVLEVETGETGERALRVGKQITPRTLVVFSQGIEDPDQRKLRIEYQVFGPVLVAGEQDFRGGMGGDVFVRFRFR